MAFTGGHTNNLKQNVLKKERVTLGEGNPETQELIKLGVRFTPDGNIHVGSAALHFYVNKLGPEIIIKVQITPFNKVTENIAQEGLKEFIAAIMKLYGKRPPRKRFEDWSDNTTGKAPG